MYFIHEQADEHGAMSNPQTTPFKNALVLPDEFLGRYIECSGFVIVTHENGVITSIAPNTEALEKWRANQTEEVAQVSATEQLRADIDYIAVMTGVEL